MSHKPNPASMRFRLRAARELCHVSYTDTFVPDTRFLLDNITKLFTVPIDDILSRKRKPNIALARQVLHFALYSAGYTYVEIGTNLDRDHSTVINSTRRVQSRLIRDMVFRKRIKNIIRDYHQYIKDDLADIASSFELF